MDELTSSSIVGAPGRWARALWRPCGWGSTERATGGRCAVAASLRRWRPREPRGVRERAAQESACWAGRWARAPWRPCGWGVYRARDWGERAGAGRGARRALYGRRAGGGGQSARLGRAASLIAGVSLMGHGSGPPGGAQPDARWARCW